MTGSGGSSNFAGLSQSILRYANRGAARVEFLSWISDALLTHLPCDAIELWVRGPSVSYRWEFALRPAAAWRFTLLPRRSVTRAGTMEKLFSDVLRGRCDPGSPSHTALGSYWTGGAAGPYASFALIPFQVDEGTSGVMGVKRIARAAITRKNAEAYEPVAQTLGLAIANRRAQWALRERVKELTCLYEIGRIAQESGIAVDAALERIVNLLPPAWQFPEIAGARITLDGRDITTPGFRVSKHSQSAAIEVKGRARGVVEVIYSAERPEFAEGPFLAEERHLIDTVAREVSLIVARREAEEYEANLQRQLRHADRLATIGQLAAGVAHELNEPLGSILGFAQLIQKEPGVPESAARDLDRIVAASLHAREVIHKLLVFSRQKTPAKAALDLNRIVREGLYFLESRCARSGIAIGSELDPELPEIEADASQLHQVLVNLVVNSIQAMPDGGEIRIRTDADRGCVRLTVEDTGAGMSEEVKEKIFTPFFTTKDVNEGTGLGLAVVHGIVASHGGTIRVESAPGKGTRMEVRLPVTGNGKVAAT
jgi:signal transduction histidine kinase